MSALFAILDTDMSFYVEFKTRNEAKIYERFLNSIFHDMISNTYYDIFSYTAIADNRALTSVVSVQISETYIEAFCDLFPRKET